MPRYTTRLCWREDRPDDFQFFVDGKAAGRCYLIRAAHGCDVCRWTVYRVSGSDVEDTLDTTALVPPDRLYVFAPADRTALILADA